MKTSLFPSRFKQFNDEEVYECWVLKAITKDPQIAMQFNEEDNKGREILNHIRFENQNPNLDTMPMPSKGESKLTKSEMDSSQAYSRLKPGQRRAQTSYGPTI